MNLPLELIIYILNFTEEHFWLILGINLKNLINESIKIKEEIIFPTIKNTRTIIFYFDAIKCLFDDVICYTFKKPINHINTIFGTERLISVFYGFDTVKNINLYPCNKFIASKKVKLKLIFTELEKILLKNFITKVHNFINLLSTNKYLKTNFDKFVKNQEQKMILKKLTTKFGRQLKKHLV